MYQEEGEQVEDFVNRLLELATKCQFKFLCTSDTNPPVYHDRTSEFVRDRLIVGLYEDSSRARLMREKNLTLENAIQIAKTAEAAEAAKEQLKQTARSHMTASVNSLQKRKNRNYGPQKKSTHSQQNGQFNKDKRDQSVSKCSKYCGKTHAIALHTAKSAIVAVNETTLLKFVVKRKSTSERNQRTTTQNTMQRTNQQISNLTSDLLSKARVEMSRVMLNLKI